MQLVRNVLAALVSLWNRGCLGKIAVGFLALVVIGICGAPFRGPSTRSAAPTSAPVAQAVVQWTAAPQATTAPQATQKPTETPKPTSTPAPTATPEPTAPPTEVSTATPKPEPTAEPAPPQAIVAADPSAHTITENKVDPPWWPCAKGQIKGSQNRKYHLPTGQFYARTYENVTCFNTAAEAEAAGFQPSQR